MKIGTEFEFFIYHKTDKRKHFPNIISLYLLYNSDYYSIEEDMDGNCIKASDFSGNIISFEYTYSIIEFSISPHSDLFELEIHVNKIICAFSAFINQYDLMLIAIGLDPYNTEKIIVKKPYYKLINKFHQNYDIAKICSAQSHIDYYEGSLLDTINIFNRCNWINALLFSNSPYLLKNRNVLCYRDIIWENSSHGIDSKNILVSNEFASIEEYKRYNENKLIYIVYRNDTPILIPLSRFSDYLHLNEIIGSEFKSDSYKEIIIKPDIKDEKYIRSYQNVALTNKNTIEIRSDCQQPFSRLILPAAFNLGVSISIKEISNYLHNIHFNHVKLRRDSILEGFNVNNQNSTKGYLQELVLDILYIIRENYRKRELGEEFFVDKLIKQIHLKTNPAIEFIKILDKEKSVLKEWNSFNKNIVENVI